MDAKQKHTIAMWISDCIGSMIGGMLITMFFAIVIYYGFDAGSLLCR